MNSSHHEEIRQAVRAQYGEVARAASPTAASPTAGATTAGCCTVGADPAGGCCGPAPSASLALGYSASDVEGVPEGANLGLGCGNPRAIAALRPGESVLDLGAGGGFDCFLAAQQVGPTGRVLGVDMTPEMVTKARANAERFEGKNVEFRLGEIERLPVADATIDVVLSNCVINLSPDKESVFREAFRVLVPGGRLAISDVVKTTEIPPEFRDDRVALTGCVAGATSIDELEVLLRLAGFTDVRITVNEESRSFIRDWLPGERADRYVASATIEATKPTTKSCCGPSCCGGTSSP